MSNTYDIDYKDNFFDMLSDIKEIKRRKKAFETYSKATIEHFDYIINNYDKEYKIQYEMTPKEREEWQNISKHKQQASEQKG
jgi:hypothetical protein|tara:strand:- start:2 stop:247 length:246 start_codon:yes stop_codon:yes gene_type:complete